MTEFATTVVTGLCSRFFRSVPTCKTLAQNGRTVFFSSHILGEVEAVCDRIGIMSEGKLVADNTPEALRNELNLGSSITLELETVPDDPVLDTVDGVRDVHTDNSVVEVSVSDPATKVEIVKEFDRRTRVLDILSEDTSLEQLFNTYTNNGQVADEASSAEKTAEPMEAQP